MNTKAKVQHHLDYFQHNGHDSILDRHLPTSHKSVGPTYGSPLTEESVGTIPPMYDGQTIDERGPWVSVDKWSGKHQKTDPCFLVGHDPTTNTLYDGILRVRRHQSESILILDNGKVRSERYP
jgi:hypothetical protein